MGSLARWIETVSVFSVAIFAVLVVSLQPTDWKRMFRVAMLPLLLRIFTVFEVFRDVVSMFTISMKAASDLIVIICLFIYLYAHVGVDLFGSLLGDTLSRNLNFS